MTQSPIFSFLGDSPPEREPEELEHKWIWFLTFLPNTRSRKENNTTNSFRETEKRVWILEFLVRRVKSGFTVKRLNWLIDYLIFIAWSTFIAKTNQKYSWYILPTQPLYI